MDSHSQRARATPPAPARQLSSISDFLAPRADGTRDVPRDLWGFGGLHGGLALAAMVAELSGADPAHRLRSVAGRLHRPVREPFSVAVTADSATRSTSSYSARILADAPQQREPAHPVPRALASATALFGAAGDAHAATFAPPAPRVPGWSTGELIVPPVDFVPVSAHTEVRAVGPNRPFAGVPEAKLTAWVRLTSSDEAPGDLLLLVLADALAPSYGAILTGPRAIPTVELTAQFSGGAAVSPWLLVEAQTSLATAGGWVGETINVWGEDSGHLLEARQLRLVRAEQV